MKYILSICLIMGTLAVFPQSNKYEASMEALIQKMDTAQSASVFNTVGNAFERIANAEINQWLPYYYASYCYTLSAFTARDAKTFDSIADKCDKLLDKADSLSKKNSEIMCLRAMTNSMRIMVDPQSRGMKYSMLSSQNLMEAKRLDPSNPRPYLLEAQSKLYTPEQWGGGKEVARKTLEEASKRLESFKPASKIDPSWGLKLKEMIETQLK